MNWRTGILGALLLAQAGQLAGEENGAEPAIPLAEPPQTLRDADGEPETDLIDPFQRRTEGVGGEENESGLSRTSIGEISDEFRILSIIVPQNTNTLPMALIKLHTRAEPHLIRPGDLVRVDRNTALRSVKSSRSLVSSSPSLKPEDVLKSLEQYTFYLNVKEIHPTYIEVFHNKKSPDETIILSW